MEITGIIWLDHIKNKVQSKHHLEPEDVEDIFTHRPQYRLMEKGRIQGEHVYAAYGQTRGGRYLTVIFIRKFGGKALIITARDMDDKERKQYGT